MLSFLIAQGAAPSSGSNSFSWFVVIFCVILGLIVALNPTKRTTEIKKFKD